MTEQSLADPAAPTLVMPRHKPDSYEAKHRAPYAPLRSATRYAPRHAAEVES